MHRSQCVLGIREGEHSSLGPSERGLPGGLNKTSYVFRNCVLTQYSYTRSNLYFYPRAVGLTWSHKDSKKDKSSKDRGPPLPACGGRAGFCGTPGAWVTTGIRVGVNATDELNEGGGGIENPRLTGWSGGGGGAKRVGDEVPERDGGSVTTRKEEEEGALEVRGGAENVCVRGGIFSFRVERFGNGCTVVEE